MTDTARLARSAALASVGTALFLGGIKGYAAWTTGSVAMLGSLADSALDLIASLVTLFGVHVASRPADEDHRFGHGKAEALAALFQVAVITVSAIAILSRAVRDLGSGQVVTKAEYGIGVSILAILATLALTRYQAYVVRRTGSLAIGTDRVHYTSDLLLNAAVILALVLEHYVGLHGADPVFGIGIALWLLFGAWRASIEAIDQLMDKEWPEDRRRRFVEVASRHPELKGLHDLRIRTSGNRDFAQFHMWMDPHMTISAAHDVVEALERALEAEFPGMEVLIHIDPVGQVDHPGNPLVERDEVAQLRQAQ